MECEEQKQITMTSNKLCGLSIDQANLSLVSIFSVFFLMHRIWTNLNPQNSTSLDQVLLIFFFNIMRDPFQLWVSPMIVKFAMLQSGHACWLYYGTQIKALFLFLTWNPCIIQMRPELVLKLTALGLWGKQVKSIMHEIRFLICVGGVAGGRCFFPW